MHSGNEIGNVFHGVVRQKARKIKHIISFFFCLQLIWPLPRIKPEVTERNEPMINISSQTARGKPSRLLMDGWMNQAYSRLSTTHGHITDCKLLVCMY